MHLIKHFRIVLLIIFIAGNSFAQGLKPISLPAPQTEIGKPLLQVLKLRQSSRSFDSKPLPLQELSNLLWAAYGINRPETGKRTAPSAMNRQEIDIYVALPEGVFTYDAKANILKAVAEGDLRLLCGMQDFVKSAPLNLIYIADISKVSQGSDEDKKFYTAANCGFIAENVYLYCASQNLAVVVRAMVDRDKLSQALKLRKEQTIIFSQTVGFPK